MGGVAAPTYPAARAATTEINCVGAVGAGATNAGASQGATAGGSSSSTSGTPAAVPPIAAVDNSSHSIVALLGRTVTIVFPTGTTAAYAGGVTSMSSGSSPLGESTAGLAALTIALPTMVLVSNGTPGDINVSWTADGTTFSSMNVQFTTTTLAAIGSNTKPVAAKKKVGTSATTKVAYVVAGVAVVGLGTAAYLRFR